MPARAALAALFALAVAGGASAAKPLTERITTPRFEIHYTKGDYFSADLVSRAAEEHFIRIAADLGYSGRGPRIPVFIYPNHREFVAATGTDRQKFILGRAHAGVEKIELDSQELFEPLEPVAAHEVAHIIVFRIVGPSADVPLWAHEGIAKFESGDWDDLDARILSEAVTQGRLLLFSELREAFPEDREALAYVQSASFVKYLAGQYGPAALRRVLKQTQATGSFERAVRLVTGAPLSKLEKDWLPSLRRQYAPYLWVRFVSTAALGALPILVILAYLVVRSRRRKLLEKYDREEWEEANRRDWGNSWPGGGLQ